MKTETGNLWTAQERENDRQRWSGSARFGLNPDESDKADRTVAALIEALENCREWLNDDFDSSDENDPRSEALEALINKTDALLDSLR